MVNHPKGFHFETMKEILVMMVTVNNLQENDFWKLATMLEFMYKCRRKLL
jgi:adenine specific DNA methylase Mod